MLSVALSCFLVAQAGAFPPPSDSGMAQDYSEVLPHLRPSPEVPGSSAVTPTLGITLAREPGADMAVSGEPDCPRNREAKIMKIPTQWPGFVLMEIPTTWPCAQAQEVTEGAGQYPTEESQPQ